MIRRTIILLVIIVISLYTGAHFGKENLNKYAFAGGKQIIRYTKLSCVWVTKQWKNVGKENEDTNI